ncbi:MAG: PAS domain S-box protein [Spirochaetes bacterium]|nr:PAS domain S-box protein [Spirochaetota bacterium]
MKDRDKTKTQLIAELQTMRRLVSESEKSRAGEEKSKDKPTERDQQGLELIKSLPQIVCETDENGVLTYINDYALKAYGYTKRDFNKGLTALQMLVPQDHKRAASNMKEIMRGKQKSGGNEYTALKKDGTTFPIMIYSAPLIRENRVTGLQSIIVDITDRKKAEEELKEEAVRRRILVEQSRDGIVVLDENGKVYEANQRYAEMLGYSPEEVLQLHLWDWDTHFPPEELKEMLRKVDEKGDHFETRHRRKDGSYYDVEISTNGAVCGGQKLVFCVCRDISDRKRAEERLRESEERFRVVIENFPDSVFVHDTEGRFIMVNDALCKNTGYSQEEMYKMTVADIDAESVARGDREKLWLRLQQSGFVRIETTNKRKDGSKYPVEVHLNAITLKGKAVILGVARDSTERKRAAEEKAKLEKQLRRSQRLETVGTLAGGIAHDFNNILTPIIGYSDLALSEMPADDHLVDYLEAILKGANRAKDLVKQILTFSRQIEKDRKPLTVQHLIKEALKLLRPSIPSTIEIRQHIDDSCGKVFADPGQIQQIIVNLCTNAFHAMEEKGGVLAIELTQVTVDEATAKIYSNLSENEYVRLTVRDSGIGMDESTIDRIFEPFFTTKSVDKGSGLGLSVVHGIVRSHLGEIIVQSEPKKGSTFHVYLPVIKKAVETGGNGTKPVLRGDESILVVDDEKLVLSVIKTILAGLGYSVEAHNCGVDALKSFDRKPAGYDLVITDLTMPGTTGLELAKHIHTTHPDLPVILMTGYGEKLNTDIQKHYNIREVIGKPISMSDLAAAVRTVLDE